jgi:hypothetical protein
MNMNEYFIRELGLTIGATKVPIVSREEPTNCGSMHWCATLRRSGTVDTFRTYYSLSSRQVEMRNGAGWTTVSHAELYLHPNWHRLHIGEMDDIIEGWKPSTGKNHTPNTNYRWAHPTLETILNAMRRDCLLAEYSFYEWSEALGLSLGDKNTLKTWEALGRKAREIKQFFGSHYGEFMAIEDNANL